MDGLTDPRGQQAATEVDRVLALPSVQLVHDMHAARSITHRRTAQLYVRARQHYDVPGALATVGQALRLSRDPIEAWHQLGQLLPGPRGPRLDGSVLRARLACCTPSRRLVPGPHGGEPDRRERVTRWQLQADAPVLWRHQWGPTWDRRAAAVGAIVGARTDPVGDLTVWIRVTDAALQERALFDGVACSPGIDVAASTLDRSFDRQTWEPAQVWQLASIRELSLCAPDEATLVTAVQVVAGVPADLASPAAPTIEPWDEPRSERAAVPVYRTTRGPGGLLVQWRPAPGLHVS